MPKSAIFTEFNYCKCLTGFRYIFGKIIICRIWNELECMCGLISWLRYITGNKLSLKLCLRNMMYNTNNFLSLPKIFLDKKIEIFHQKTKNLCNFDKKYCF